MISGGRQGGRAGWVRPSPQVGAEGWTGLGSWQGQWWLHPKSRTWSYLCVKGWDFINSMNLFLILFHIIKYTKDSSSLFWVKEYTGVINNECLQQQSCLMSTKHLVHWTVNLQKWNSSLHQSVQIRGLGWSQNTSLQVVLDSFNSPILSEIFLHCLQVAFWVKCLTVKKIRWDT